MIYLFLADGFEDVEAIGTIDILRRCGLQVQTLSVSGKRVVTSAHGVVIKADSIFRKNHLLNCEAMVFPGGLKGAESMAKNTILRQTVMQQAMQGTFIAAICAAPMILGAAGVIRNKHVTIYPGMEAHVAEGIYHNNAYVVEHDNFITASGPAATRYFATAIARHLLPMPNAVDEVEHAMGFTASYAGVEPILKFN